MFLCLKTIFAGIQEVAGVSGNRVVAAVSEVKLCSACVWNVAPAACYTWGVRERRELGRPVCASVW